MKIGHWVYKRAVRMNIPAHVHFVTFSCYKRLPLLTNELWRTWLADSIRYACAKLDYALWAYVFMPEHVHLLYKPRREKYNVSDFIKLIKNPVANRILNRLRLEFSPLLTKLQVSRSGPKRYR